ncbi:MAG TPA: hypothetical protein IAA99_03850, partial [Candidatus Avibacteroides faecavium]|nr:hypothetical protein [Candidatus Avibacteroides faecavium]
AVAQLGFGQCGEHCDAGVVERCEVDDGHGGVVGVKMRDTPSLSWGGVSRVGSPVAR